MPLPITAIFPIYECADRLESHLALAQAWLDSVEEVIVVDSGSKDGSADLARREIRHPNIRHEVVPPGLYAAWNHGVGLAGAEFCYFATVGDTIDRDGLEHLALTARKLAADVVVSPPRCVTESREPATGRIFPIHSILAASDISEPMSLPPWLADLMATGFSIESFLGSSASNLYRTGCLKRNPFPTGFGKAGDTAWFRENALRYRFAMTPRICADFCLHQEHSTRPHGEISDLLDRLTQISEKAFLEARGLLDEADVSGMLVFKGWRDVAGLSPEKTLDAIRHLEGVAATAEQQRKYIEELKEHMDQRLKIIEELTAECARLRLKPEQDRGLVATLGKRFFRQ